MARKPAAKKTPPASYRDEALRVQDKEHFSGKPQKPTGPLEKPIKKPTPSKGSLVPVKKAPRTGNVNKASPPKVISQGHTPGSASRAVVPYKAPVVNSALKTSLKTVAKVAGPIGAAIGFIADASPAGAGSDKPKGPLMEGNSYIKPKAAAAIGVQASGKGSLKVSATPAPKPKAKPSVAPPKPTARPSFSKASTTPPAYTPEKAQKRGSVTSGFSGNWQNAAPSEMQKRGGAKKNYGGGLLGKLRGK